MFYIYIYIYLTIYYVVDIVLEIDESKPEQLKLYQYRCLDGELYTTHIHTITQQQQICLNASKQMIELNCP